MVQTRAFNRVEDLCRGPNGRNEIEPSPGIYYVLGHRKDLQRERVPIPKTIKKPSVEMFLLDGFLYPFDIWRQKSSSNSSISNFSEMSGDSVNAPQLPCRRSRLT